MSRWIECQRRIRDHPCGGRLASCSCLLVLLLENVGKVDPNVMAVALPHPSHRRNRSHRRRWQRCVVMMVVEDASVCYQLLVVVACGVCQTISHPAS